MTSPAMHTSGRKGQFFNPLGTITHLQEKESCSAVLAGSNATTRVGISATAWMLRSELRSEVVFSTRNDEILSSEMVSHVSAV
jgi:hypothetical protein